jgi:hypothetical protein
MSVFAGRLATPASDQAKVEAATTRKLSTLMKAGSAAGARKEFPTAAPYRHCAANGGRDAVATAD